CRTAIAAAVVESSPPESSTSPSFVAILSLLAPGPPARPVGTQPTGAATPRSARPSPPALDEQPGAKMYADARPPARRYAAPVSDVGGVRLPDPATVRRMTVVQTDKTRMHALPPGLTIPADRSFCMSLGFWRACPPMPWLGPGSFGHPGSGGS